MTVRTAEKRSGIRSAASYPAVVADRHGRIIARGRTANISAGGVFIIGRYHGQFACERVQIILTVPSASSNPSRPQATRTVIYNCRVVRTQNLGHLLGLGLQFLEKLA